MKKYEKLLRKLSGKSRILVIGTIDQLITGDTIGLDIVRLQDNFFRCRTGNYRIFFHYENGKIGIDYVRKRNEKTYRDL